MKSNLLGFFISLIPLLACSGSDDDFIAKNGGSIQVGGKGFLAVIDCRADGEVTEYASGITQLKNIFEIDVKQSRAKDFSFDSLNDHIKATKGNAAVFVLDDPAWPMALSAPEDRWAMVNIAKLKTDNPTEGVLQQRANVMIVRQGCRALGSDESASTNSCAYTALSLTDLDKVVSLEVPMNTFFAVAESMKRRGIEPIVMVTYSDACDMGVAPPPTNDIQRAIWQKAANKKADKADPTNRWKRDFPDKGKPKAK